MRYYRLRSFYFGRCVHYDKHIRRCELDPSIVMEVRMVGSKQNRKAEIGRSGLDNWLSICKRTQVQSTAMNTGLDLRYKDTAIGL